MTDLREGDILCDNDPRMPNRKAVVVKAHPNGVMVVLRDHLGRERSYLRCRIYTDGKPRKKGWSLVGRSS